MRIVVVCDNTMGIPGKEIDDGLALLYLMGLEDIEIEAVCCTHGNSSTEDTFAATKQLFRELDIDAPVLRGADAPDDARVWIPLDTPAQLEGNSRNQPPSEAARVIAGAPTDSDSVALLSLGAATDLAAAEQLSPGCLSRYSAIALMGGITHTLFVGGNVMNELNFSVDGQAACNVLASARNGAVVRLADAWNCLPLTFQSVDFINRLVLPGFTYSDVLKKYCLPWMEFARTAWNTGGFVGWDVLAAVALAHPDLVEFIPFEVACNPRLLSVGYLERAQAPELASPISLVAVRDAQELCEHVFQAWERAVQG